MAPGGGGAKGRAGCPPKQGGKLHFLFRDMLLGQECAMQEPGCARTGDPITLNAMQKASLLFRCSRPCLLGLLGKNVLCKNRGVQEQVMLLH